MENIEKEVADSATSSSKAPTILKMTAILDKENGIYVGGLISQGSVITNIKIDGTGYYRLTAQPFFGKRGKLKPYGKIQQLKRKKPDYYVLSSIPFMSYPGDMDYILSHIALCEIARAMNVNKIVNINECSLESFEGRRGYALAFPYSIFSKDLQLDIEMSIDDMKKQAKDIYTHSFSDILTSRIMSGAKTATLNEVMQVYYKYKLNKTFR